jgi:hypothetical protein
LSSGSWTVGLASTDANKETAPALGGGERWGRYRCVRRAGGSKAKTQLDQNSISGSVMMVCIDHPAKFSTSCGLFWLSRATQAGQRLLSVVIVEHLHLFAEA